jgi:hypothetical protein
MLRQNCLSPPSKHLSATLLTSALTQDNEGFGGLTRNDSLGYSLAPDFAQLKLFWELFGP